MSVTRFLSICRKQMSTVNATCVRAFERDCGARKRRNHIFAKLYRLYLSPILTQKIWLRYQDNFLSCGAILCEKLWRPTVPILPQTLGKMGHQVNHFHLQKRKSGVMFRRLPFSITLKEFLNYFNSLQSYGQNS